MVNDFTKPACTQALIDESRPHFYPARIPPQHHQLKHFVSARVADHLYYASGDCIYALHLPTAQRILVKKLAWKPTCLDAAHGWIGAGGYANGQCVFIKIKATRDGSIPSESPASNQGPGIEPLDLDPEPQTTSSMMTNLHSPTTRYVSQQLQMGKEIVNSVVIQVLRGIDESSEDEVVAVMTNNDRSVHIFSLSKWQLHPSPPMYPVPMNHASFSPNGATLLAVGDIGHAYFIRRRSVASKPDTWRWVEAGAQILPLTDKKDCCFTSAWSPSGHVCAVAAQSGIVTIIFNSSFGKNSFKTSRILRSSRSNTTSFRGAIRSMKFSSAQHDLLVFSEDQGRCTVVDLRNEIRFSQTLDLDPSATRINRIRINVGESVHCLSSSAGETNVTNNNISFGEHFLGLSEEGDNMALVTERRRVERANELNALRLDPPRLSESEIRMIDSIGARRAFRSELSDNIAPATIERTSNFAQRSLSNMNLPEVLAPIQHSGLNNSIGHTLQNARNREHNSLPEPTGELLSSLPRDSRTDSDNNNDLETAMPSTPGLYALNSVLSASPTQLSGIAVDDTTVQETADDLREVLTRAGAISSFEPWTWIGLSATTSNQDSQVVRWRRRDAQALSSMSGPQNTQTQRAEISRFRRQQNASDLARVLQAPILAQSRAASDDRSSEHTMSYAEASLLSVLDDPQTRDAVYRMIVSHRPFRRTQRDQRRPTSRTSSRPGERRIGIVRRSEINNTHQSSRIAEIINAVRAFENENIMQTSTTTNTDSNTQNNNYDQNDDHNDSNDDDDAGINGGVDDNSHIDVNMTEVASDHDNDNDGGDDSNNSSLSNDYLSDDYTTAARLTAGTSASAGEGRPTNRFLLQDIIGQPRAEDGVTTMGVDWSPDGKSLFVGTEVGIFQYTVNLQNRKLFPGVEFL